MTGSLENYRPYKTALNMCVLQSAKTSDDHDMTIFQYLRGLYFLGSRYFVTSVLLVGPIYANTAIDLDYKPGMFVFHYY